MGRSLKVAFFLAGRAIGRGHVRVSILSISVMVLVYINIALGPALIDGLVDLINHKVRTTLSGDIVVQSDGTTDYLLEAGALASQIEAVDGVAAAVPLTLVGYQVRHEGRQFTSTLTAVDPDDYRSVFATADYLIEGSFLEPDDTGQVVLGIGVAGADREFDSSWASLRTINAGDRITVTLASGTAREYTVKGIFQTEMPYSDIKAFITRRELAIISPGSADIANQVCVRAEGGRELGPIARQIQGLRQGLSVGTWEEVAGMVQATVESVRSIYFIIQVIALAVAGLTIAMVTYIDLANRRRQMGILRGIGITDRSLILSYTFRALFLYAAGTLVALVLFAFVIVPLERQHPLHVSFGDILLPVEVSYLLTAAALLCVVSLFSAAIPAWQATRVQVVDAIWAG